MKILFLDDDIKRWWKMRSINFSNEIKWWKEADQCIKSLENESWDLVDLDHDLEGIYQDSSSYNCGMEVVRWMEKNIDKIRVKNFNIHSYNDKAAFEMARRIKKLGFNCSYTPFGYSVDITREQVVDTMINENFFIEGAIIINNDISK